MSSEFVNEPTKVFVPVNAVQPSHQLAARPFVIQPKAEETITAAPSSDRLQQLDTGVMQTLNLQAKLAIGAPGDQYEQEADTVAAQVVDQINAPQTIQQPIQRQDMPEEEDEKLQMKPLGGIIQRQETPEEDEKLQMKPLVQRSTETATPASASLEASIGSARGQGQPLGDNVRGSMEQAFGADFSSVRVHSDTQSDQLNQSIQARAFTTGQDIFFRQGEYQPGNRGGQELLAHELTHVVQQNGSLAQAKK